MTIWTIVWFIFLLMLSGFFSSTEIALMSIPSHKVESLVRSGRWGARQVQNLKKNTDKLLVAILIGNNLVNTLIASLATKIAIDMADTSGMEQSIAVWLSTGFITFLLLTFWEIIPKSFWSKNAESLAIFSAYPYKVLLTVFAPVIFIFEVLINLFTGKSRSHHTMSDEELESFIDLWKDAGTIDESEHKKLIGVLELDNLTAEDIMTPRVDIEGVSDEATVQDAIEHFMQHEHTRIPIYTKEIDKIHSFITMRDLFTLKEQKQEHKKLKEVHLRKVLRIPLNQPLDKLLELLQKNNKHLAIIIDEYGGVAGLITMEDIIEEVFWEIHDESDTEFEEIKEIEKDVLLIDATVMIDEVLEVFDLELYHIGLDVKEFSAETTGFIITHKLERFPHTKEAITFPIVENDDISQDIEKLTFKVLDVHEGKLWDIEVKVVRNPNLVKKK